MLLITDIFKDQFVFPLMTLHVTIILYCLLSWVKKVSCVLSATLTLNLITFTVMFDFLFLLSWLYSCLDLLLLLSLTLLCNYMCGVFVNGHWAV